MKLRTLKVFELPSFRNGAIYQYVPIKVFGLNHVLLAEKCRHHLLRINFAFHPL